MLESSRATHGYRAVMTSKDSAVERFEFAFAPAYRLPAAAFDRGVCVELHEPVRVLDPTGRLRHPGATFTVADPDRLARTLEAR